MRNPSACSDLDHDNYPPLLVPSAQNQPHRHSLPSHTASVRKLVSALADQSDNYIYLIDAENRVQYSNPKVLELLQIREPCITGRRVDEFVSAQRAKRSRQHYREVISGNRTISGINSVQLSSGETRYFWYVKQPLRWAGKPLMMGMSTDITDLYTLKEELQVQARTDALTGLYNRRHFFEHAKRELARAQRHQQPLSLLLMDIDHFKRINDRYGHPAGDRVLSEIATCLQDEIRQEDLLARIGGEEFALLLPDTNLSTAKILAERIRSRIEALQINAGGQLIRPTLSLGAALLEPGDETLDTLYQRSDQALYRAKESGRNRVCSCDEAC